MIILDNSDGIISRGKAALRPTVRAKIGKQTVEKPSPVIPFTDEANKYVDKITMTLNRL